jgi:hypothetical protein
MNKFHALAEEDRQNVMNKGAAALSCETVDKNIIEKFGSGARSRVQPTSQPIKQRKQSKQPITANIIIKNNLIGLCQVWR